MCYQFMKEKNLLNVTFVGKKLFKCDTCDAEFTTKQSLRMNYESVHEEIKAFQCNLCNARKEAVCNK